MNDQTYQPLCRQCDEDGVIALATEVVEGPYGRQPACPRHFTEAGERGATMWELNDGGAAEQISRGYDAMESRRR